MTSLNFSILESLPDTLSLVRKIAQTGISALAVHARFVSDTPKTTPHWNYFTSIVQIMNEYDIPVLANGDVFEMKDVLRLKEMGTSR